MYETSKGLALSTALVVALSVTGCEDKKESSASTASASVSATGSAKSASTKKKTGPAALAGEVAEAVAFIGKTAKADKVDTKAKKNEPFFVALKKVAKGAEALKKGQTDKKSAEFFKSVHNLGKAVGELRITAKRSSYARKKASKAVEQIEKAYQQLSKKFSKEAARKKKGGALSDKEKSQAQKLKEKKTALESKIKPIRDKIKAKGSNAAFTTDLDELLKDLDELGEIATLDEYLDALDTFTEIEGEWLGLSYYVPAEGRDLWGDVEDWEGVDVILVDSEDLVEFDDIDEWDEIAIEEDEIELDIAEDELEADMDYIEELDVEIDEGEYIDEFDDSPTDDAPIDDHPADDEF